MAPGFTGQTPESLLARSDSKNPANTCKGITKLGRPCRNPLDLEAIRNASGNNGVLAVTSVVGDDSDEEEVGAAAFFCWRHKDQAEKLVNANVAKKGNGQDTVLFPLQNRSSIDTLVAKLGVQEMDTESQPKERRKRREDRDAANGRGKLSTRVNRPPTWDRVHGPLMSVPSDVMKQQQPHPRPPRQQKQSFWAAFCCGAADEDYVEVVRHKKRVDRPPQSLMANQYTSDKLSQRPVRTQAYTNRYSNPSGRPSSTQASATSVAPGRKPLGEKPAKPLNKTSPSASPHTPHLLSYIPPSLDPHTTSLLLAELAKPISPHDDAGYLYIFWLTPTSLGPAPSSTASSLLTPSSRPDHGRRTSDMLRQYSVHQADRPRRASATRSTSSPNDAKGSEETKKTILLKIGRANNVHRRMTEWSRQCGYSLSLVRFYPYVPSSSPSVSPATTPQPKQAGSRRSSLPADDGSLKASASSDRGRASSLSAVRQVPHVHRVERLVHLELADKRVVKRCEACGKEHREWFEVEASREGVKGVDEVVRRWVEWAESVGGRDSTE